MKEYRVDVFSDKQIMTKYFDTEAEAVKYGERQSYYGAAFLLKEVIDGKFDVLKELKV